MPAPPEIIFVSLNQAWVNAMVMLVMKHNLSHRIDVVNQDIQTISLENTAFVSPANSLGFMDGGVDAVLSRKMFKDVQQRVQRKIRQINLTTALGRFYLPVGSAIIVPTDTPAHLIAAPTMFLPHDVSTTRNAYHSVYAALHMWHKFTTKTATPIKTLVFTSHCCGYGGMSPQESAQQMFSAYLDFITADVPNEISHASEADILHLQDRDDEQPDNYDNREIKEISFERLITTG
jgi:O-acetyl-ADP-ribose deacetylase (regulator of RNase III)